MNFQVLDKVVCVSASYDTYERWMLETVKGSELVEEGQVYIIRDIDEKTRSLLLVEIGNDFSYNEAELHFDMRRFEKVHSEKVWTEAERKQVSYLTFFSTFPGGSGCKHSGRIKVF